MTSANAMSGATKPDRRPPQVIGFVGLGNMGVPMVAQLAAGGYELRPWDADPKARERAGAGNAPSDLSEAVLGADVLILMLPNGRVVQEVLFGDGVDRDGVVGVLADDTVIVDMGSSSPQQTRDTASRLRASGLRFVDAPVSGGVPAAREGRLSIMVGGDSVDVARVEPLLRVLGDSIIHLGDVGSGQTAKCLNNLLSACGMIAAAEVVAAAASAGLDPGRFVDLVNSSSGRNDATVRKMKQYVLSGSFDAGFSAALMDKDLRHSEEVLAADAEARTLATHVIGRWHDFVAAFPDGDHTEICRLVAPDLVVDTHG